MDDFLPTLVGYRTAILENGGIQLDLQVAMTLEDQQNRRYVSTSMAMPHSVAMDLAKVLSQTVDLARKGPQTLQ